MENPFSKETHDEDLWDGDEVEKEDDLPDPSVIIVSTPDTGDNDVAP